MRTLAIIFALCCIYFDTVAAMVKTEQIYLEFPGKELVFDHHSFTDEKFVYAVCDKNSDNHAMSCAVKRQKSTTSNDTYSCDINIQAKNERGKLLKKFQVVPFGHDKIIAVVAEIIKNEQQKGEAFIKIKTIELESCKINEVRVSVEAWSMDHMDPMLTTVVVPCGDFFQVVYPNTNLCLKAHCRLTFDKDGKIVEMAIGRDLKEPLVPIQADSLNKGLLYLDREHLYVNGHYTGQIELSVWRPDGSKTKIDTFNVLNVQGSVRSTAHNAIGLCSKHGDIFTCLEYDFDNKLKLNATLSEYIVHRTYLISMHNLPDGVFGVLHFSVHRDESD